MVCAQHYCVRFPFLTVVGVLQKQIRMDDSLTLGKILLLCQKKVCNDKGFESAERWGCRGHGDFGFLQEWANVFFEFTSSRRKIKTS